MNVKIKKIYYKIKINVNLRKTNKKARRHLTTPGAKPARIFKPRPIKNY